MNASENAFIKASDLIQTLLSQDELKESLSFDGYEYLDMAAPFLIYAGLAEAFDRYLKKAVPVPSPSKFKLWLKSKAFLNSLSIMYTKQGNLEDLRSGSPRKALMLGFTPYFSREVLVPLHSYLNKERTFSPIIVNDRGWKGFPRAGEEGHGISIWNAWNPAAAKKLRKLVHDLMRAQDRFAKHGLFQSAINKIDSSLTPYMMPHLNLVLYWTLPKLAAYHALASTLLPDIMPTILVNPDVSDYRTRIFEAVAQRAGVPSLGVQFGVHGKNDVEWRFFRSNHLAVTGEKNYKFMLQHYVQANRMTITGSPRFDVIADQLGTMTARYQVTNKSAENIRVLFASQPFYYGAFSSPKARVAMIESLLRAVSQHSKIELVVKPHPVENKKELLALLSPYKNIVLASPHDDIRRLTAEADAFVTFFSGSAFEALAWGKPVMNLCFPNSYVDTMFIESNATYLARNYEEIVKFLNVLSSNELGREDGVLPSSKLGRCFLNSWFDCSKGVPSGNIVKLMDNMTRSI